MIHLDGPYILLGDTCMPHSPSPLLQNTLLLGAALTLLVSQRQSTFFDKVGVWFPEKGKPDQWVDSMCAVFLMASMTCCAVALCTSTAYSMILSSKSVPVGFDDAAPIAEALRTQPSNYPCNSIPQMYSLAAFMDGTHWTTSESSKEICNTVVNYINLLCTKYGSINLLLYPQSCTIAAVVLFLVGILLHLLLTTYLYVAVIYASSAIVIFAVVIALVTTVSGSITDQSSKCNWQFYGVN